MLVKGEEMNGMKMKEKKGCWQGDRDEGKEDPKKRKEGKETRVENI